MSWTLVALELAIGVSGGALAPDSDLARYRWDTAPRPALGARALLAHRTLALGLGAWTAETTQGSGLEEVESPSVRLASVELLGEWRALTVLGTGLVARASAGRVHIGYDPDRATAAIDGTPITVRFDPIDEWILGAGLALRRPLARRLTAGVRVDHHAFGLETAHRNGERIETTRERFGSWSARLELGYHTTLR